MSADIQIIERDGKPEYAVIPIDEWRRVCELAEDAEDIRLASKAARELAEGDDEIVPLEVVRELLTGRHPLGVWRNYRGLTQQALADSADVGVSYISQIESGAKSGSVKLLRRLAEVLRVDIDDLVPL